MTHNGPKLQAAKGRQLRVVLQSSCFIFTWEMEHSLFEFVGSSATLDTTLPKTTLTRVPCPEGRSFTKHLPVLTPTEARAPAIKCCIPPSVNPMRTLFFTAEKTFLGGSRLCWQNTHIAEEDNLRHVGGLFCQQGGTSIRTWVAHHDSMVAASKKEAEI